MNSRLRWPLPDERVDLAGEQIDPGQQAERAMAFVIADPARSSHDGLAPAANSSVVAMAWIQASRREETIATGFFDFSALAAAFFRDLDLAVDTQNFRHLGLELGVAAFQIVAHLVRLDFTLDREACTLAYALSQTGETLVTRRRSALARRGRANSRVVHSSCG